MESRWLGRVVLCSLVFLARFFVPGVLIELESEESMDLVYPEMYVCVGDVEVAVIRPSIMHVTLP